MGKLFKAYASHVIPSSSGDEKKHEKREGTIILKIIINNP